MKRFRADLHIHTVHSDGTASTKELVQLAKECGLSGLSITDHDTIAAYKEAFPIAKELGVRLVPGIELSAIHKNTSVHILGYAFSEESKLIHNYCDRHYKRRRNRNLKIIELLSKHSIFLSEEDVQRECQGTPGRPHIAKAMLKKRYVTNMQEAFNRYIGDDKPCFAYGDQVSAEETLQVIHDAGGIAVIAHPHQIKNQRVVKDLVSMNFDGIEGYYGKLSFNTEKKWIEIGKQKEWLITGGSDYHGDIKPQNTLGCSWVNEETFQHLYLHYLSQQTNV